MSVNLLRNSRVFFTTNVSTVDPTKGVINASGFTAGNTREIQVLDDISFSQATNAETISLNEAGASPKRSQRSFNTSLNPVEFSFSTYMRPHADGISGVIGPGFFFTFNGNPVNAGNPATDYGPATTVTVPSPMAGGKPAIFTPVFGGITNEVVGFNLVDGGSGFVQGTTLTQASGQISIFDPDAPAETSTAWALVLTAPNTILTGTSKITCEENVLWNAMFSNQPIGNPSSSWTDGSIAATKIPATCVLTNSNQHQLQRFGMIVVFDQSTYLLDDCSLNQAVIDFGIDAIATIQWSGQARKIRRLPSALEEVRTLGTGGGSEYTGYWRQPEFAATTTSGSTTLTVTGITALTPLSGAAPNFSIEPQPVLTAGSYITAGAGIPAGTQIVKQLSIDPAASGVAGRQGTYQMSNAATASTTSGTTVQVVVDTISGIYKVKTTNCPYIANKLTTVKLRGGIGNYSTAAGTNGYAAANGPEYEFPVTGGSITLTNNITYLTPANLGVVNEPFTYFTGSRSVSGSLNAYLRTGNTIKMSANLFDDLMAQVTTDSDPEFYLSVEIGGINSNTHVDLIMPATVLQIPTVNSEQVVTTTINFTAQSSEDAAGVTTNAFQILNDNEIQIRYYAT